MDLVSREDLERLESGSRFIPDSVLRMLHPDVLIDASATYANMVEKYPNYEFGMIQDNIKGGVTVYWKRIA